MTGHARLALPLLALIAASGPSSAEKAAVPELLQRALTAPAAVSLFAYDFEDVTRGEHVLTVRGRIDPSRKEGERVEITHASNTDPKEKVDLTRLDERYERNAEGDIFCDSMSQANVTKVVDKGATAAGRLFTFTPQPPKEAEGEMKAIMKKVLAEAVVDEATATLKSLNFRLTKPHSVMLVASIKSMDMKVECAVATTGRSYAVRREIAIVGSGMGRSFNSRTIQSISNLRPVG